MAWYDDRYPTVPSFPAWASAGVSPNMYIMITAHIEDLAQYVAADLLGNLNLDAGKNITWTGSGKTITHNSGSGYVEVNSLANSTVDLAGDFSLDSMSITTALGATDGDVAGDTDLSATAYASIKAKITDNEIVFKINASPLTPSSVQGVISLNISGDLIIQRYEGGLKTKILADYSEM